MESSNNHKSVEQKPKNADTQTKKQQRQNVKNMTGILLAFGVSLLLVAVVALVFGQRIGYRQGESHANEQAKIDAASDELSSASVKALRLKVQTLQNQLTTAQQERDISLTNLADLRVSMQQLKITNLQVQHENKVFADLLAKQGGVPLQIIGVKINPLPENAYEYHFDVLMLDKNQQKRRLTPKLTLLNAVNMVDVPLEPKSYDIQGVARVRGRFIMPKDFNPKQAKLELSAGGERIEQIYDWQLGKPVANMPNSLADIPDVDTRPVE